MANKWVNDDALLFFGSQFKTKIEEEIPTKTSDITNDSNFVSDANYVHTDNNYTATEKSKLAAIAEGAQANVIESIKVNGTALTVTSKAVDVTVPTKTSDITNDSNFVSDANYVHTDNNYTATEKNKLSGIASGAQANIIESIKVNGTALTVTSKAVDVSVPTATSDLTNDSGFITSADVPEGATASTSTPLMDGTAAVGTSTAFARGDHVHPSDTSKANVSDLPTFKNTNDVIYPISKFTETANNTVTITSGESNVVTLAKAAYVDAIASAAQTALNGKVDAVDGKGLSTNDFTDAEKTKLAAFSAASNYALKSDITNMYKYKGSVATVSALPSSGNTTGDVYDVQENGMNYAWNGTAWDALGEIFSITAISNAEVTSIVNQVFAS